MEAPLLTRWPGPAALRRWLRRTVLAVAGVLTALVVIALAGAARDDAAIEATTARTNAEVLATGPRTVVRFATNDGQVHTPEQGVAYPQGLAPGQLVRVEYAADDPELVRVAGRSWVAGLPDAVLVLVATWSLAGPLAWWLGRRGPDPASRPPSTASAA